MEISARTDYAVRALLVLAAAPPGELQTAESIAARQGMPTRFVENILVDLRRKGLVRSQRGSSGGFALAEPPETTTLAEVIRAVDGHLTEIRGELPEHVVYEAPAAHLQHVWIAVRASMRQVLEHVTLAQIASGDLPDRLVELTLEPEAWVAR